MKSILVIIDGLGDLPCFELKGKTPLEAAEKPNLDYLAEYGKIMGMYSVGKDIVPESDTAVLSILGQNLLGSFRGYFEAMGEGLKVERGDVALRANFATIENLESKKIIDRRAGRTLTNKEARLLAEAINKNVKLPCKFVFKNTIQHRAVLILRGGFSDNVTNTDPAYHTKGKSELLDRFRYSQPLDEEENSKLTANIINEFLEQSFKILNAHSVNAERRKQNLLPANFILTRDASSFIPEMKKLENFSSVVYMPLEIGISKALGMKTFSFQYPEMKKDAYENLYSGLKKACEFAVDVLEKEGKKNEYFYIHFKETDVPGHDNKPEEKKKMIEFIDKNFFAKIKNLIEKNKIRIIVTGDHSTPCKIKGHSSDPIPFLLCNWEEKKKKNFCEREVESRKLGKIYGRDVLGLLK